MSRYFTNVKNAIEERVNTSYIDELYTKDAQGEFRKIIAGESEGSDIELPTYIKEDKIEFTNGSGLSADGLSYTEDSTTITKTIKEVFDSVPDYIKPDKIEFSDQTGLDKDRLKVRNHITIEGGGYNWHVAEYRANEIKYSIDGLNTRHISLDSLAKADGWYSYLSDPTDIYFNPNNAFQLDGAPSSKSITVFDGNKVEGAKIMVELTGYDFTALTNNGEAVVQFDINYGGSNQYPIFKASLMNIVFSYADVEDANKFYIGPTYVPEDADPITGNRRCSFTILHPPEAGLTFPPINKIYILLEFSKTMHLPTDFILNN